MAAPLKIYISSTFSDLKDYREAVIKALWQLDHEVAAMEKYTASDQRPLDKCLEDVVACDLYIGIFAWRYGYIPEKDNPEQKSITELEYRKAGEAKKERLIFLLKPDAAWNPLLMDAVTGDGDRGALITAFRAELAKEHTDNFFTTPDGLANLVTAAVTAWEKNKKEERIEQHRPDVGALVNVPDLPPHFLPRPEDIAALKQAVLADTNQPIVVTGATKKVGLQGMGGIGKSVLATALARDEDVRHAFPDGVLWLTVGQTPLLPGLQAQLANMLGDSPPAFESVQQGRAHLSKLFAERTCLLIVDDLWETDHAKAFDALGPRCQMLVTTRDGTLITALGAVEHQVDVLSKEQARLLLAEWSGGTVASLPSQAEEVIVQCGRLPLALALSAAQIRDGVSWIDLVEALQAADLAFLDHPHGSVMKSLKVSVDALSPEDARQYLALAVFPVDETIPEAAVLTLWGHANGASERTLRKLLTTFERKALLRLDGTAPQRKTSLHDLQHDYLRMVTTDLPRLHTALLAAYRHHCTDGWSSGPHDGYFFQHLPMHLLEAQQHDELRSLLFNFNWLQAKLTATDVNALLADYDLLPDDAELRLVQSAVRLSAHVLARDPAQLRSQLYARVLTSQEPPLQHLREQAGESVNVLWIRNLRQTLTPPGGPLLHTLAGHSDPVFTVTITPDGRYVISGSRDNTLKVWELRIKQEPRTLTGHSDSVYAVTVTPDGRYVISGSRDNTLKVWEFSTGHIVSTFVAESPIRCCEVAPDGRTVVAGDSSGRVHFLRMEGF